MARAEGCADAASSIWLTVAVYQGPFEEIRDAVLREYKACRALRGCPQVLAPLDAPITPPPRSALPLDWVEEVEKVVFRGPCCWAFWR